VFNKPILKAKKKSKVGIKGLLIVPSLLYEKRGSNQLLSIIII